MPGTGMSGWLAGPGFGYCAEADTGTRSAATRALGSVRPKIPLPGHDHTARLVDPRPPDPDEVDPARDRMAGSVAPVPDHGPESARSGHRDAPNETPLRVVDGGLDRTRCPRRGERHGNDAG